MAVNSEGAEGAHTYIHTYIHALALLAQAVSVNNSNVLATKRTSSKTVTFQNVTNAINTYKKTKTFEINVRQGFS
jgi:hypothetical protein